MEGLIPDLSDQITRLIHYLEEVKNLTGYDVGLQAEISNFMQILSTNLAYLNTSLPHTVSTDAIGLLANEVAEANRFMGECLEQDKFKRIWSAGKAHTTLESLRQKLVSCFQLAFVITSLDVIIEGQHRASDFQQRMLNLYFTHVSDALAARGQLQTLLQPLASETLEKLIEFLKRGGVASTGIATDESIDTENFFADVLATVEQLHPPELEWLDPDGSSSGSNHDDSSGSSEAGREASTGPSLSLWLAKSPKSSSSPRTEIVAAGEPTFSSQSNVVACVGEDSSTQRDLEAGTGASLESRLDHDNDDDCLLAIFAFIGRSLGIICRSLGYIFGFLLISASFPFWCIYGVCSCQATIVELLDIYSRCIRELCCGDGWEESVSTYEQISRLNQEYQEYLESLEVKIS